MDDTWTPQSDVALVQALLLKDKMTNVVLELSGNPLLRDAFWQLAAIGPWMLAALVLLLLVAGWRQAALASLAAGLACAALGAWTFHHTYAVTLWAGHKEAIRRLDQGALSAGFALGAAAAMVLATAYRVGRRRCFGALRDAAGVEQRPD